MIEGPAEIVQPTVIINYYSPDLSSPSEDGVEFEDAAINPHDAGFDFSDWDRCSIDDDGVDLVYESADGQRMFRVPGDEDIRDLGLVNDEGTIVERGSDVWAMARTVPVKVDHVYLVWTWDDQFFQVRVLSVDSKTVTCAWESEDLENHDYVWGLHRNWVSRVAVTRTNFPP